MAYFRTEWLMSTICASGAIESITPRQMAAAASGPKSVSRVMNGRLGAGIREGWYRCPPSPGTPKRTGHESKRRREEVRRRLELGREPRGGDLGRRGSSGGGWGVGRVDDVGRAAPRARPGRRRRLVAGGRSVRSLGACGRILGRRRDGSADERSLERGGRGGSELGGVPQAALDDGLDLGEGPVEAIAREAVEEGGEICRFAGLEAAGEQGAVGRLQAGLDRPIHRLRLEIHRPWLSTFATVHRTGPRRSVR